MVKPCFPFSKGRLLILLALMHIVLFWEMHTTLAQSITDIRGYSPDQQGLLYIKHSIPNFLLHQRRSSTYGWTEKPGSNVCTWSGVNCDNSGNVIHLNFFSNGSVLLGNINDVLYGASLIPNLVSLDLSYNAFTGTLPVSLTMPNLQVLNLHYNYIRGSLPGAWGVNSAFPQLQSADFGLNTDLSGPLPAGWGADGSSMRALAWLNVVTCNISGSLPAQWAANLPAAQQLYLSNNLISGTLPPEWSALNLTYVKVDRNSLEGTIPGAWGGNGTLQSLTELSLYSNNLTGSLPATWTQPGTLPALRLLDVSRNHLSGVVPGGWGVPGQSLFVTSGNLFCGPTPNYQLAICPRFRQNCSSTAVFPIICPAAPPLQPPVPQNGSANDYAVLMDFQALLLKSNRRPYYKDQLWTPSEPFCTWINVKCTQDGQVRALNFSLPGRVAPPIILPQGGAPAVISLGIDGSLRGDVGEFLGVLSRLPDLQYLDFSNQFLTGTIPANISFPQLTELRLTNNDIAGTLPSEWADNGAFPLLRLLQVDHNWRISGSLPAAWGRNASASMGKLEVLAAGYTNITGTLPAAWVSQLPLLSIIYLGYDSITGTLPVAWQSMYALSSLHVEGNNLSGTLPQQWCSNGAQSWPYLQELNLEANLLEGTLPASWGTSGCMPAIADVFLSRNNLTGSIPASWSNTAAGAPGFPNLKSLALLPGNDGMCGAIPAGVPVYSKGDTEQQVMSLPCSGQLAASPTVSSPAPSLETALTATSGGGGGGGGASHVGMIAGSVIGGCALVALALLGAFLLLRRKRKRRQQEVASEGESVKGTFSDAKGFEGMHDSDSIIPPSGGKTPRTTVPYSSIVRFPRKSGSDRGLSGPLTGSPRAGSGSELPSGQVAGSLWAAPGCHGAFTDSEAAADASGLLARMSLPHIMQRDWELNLDALEVEVDEEGNEVELGRGAFGVVVKGTYRMAPVAIKRLQQQSTAQQEAFLREMAILRACRGSRYIVPFVGASLLPGNTILAMDFMEVGNLWEALTRVGKNGNPIFQWNGRGRRVAYEIALGLHFLHDLRVVHLDLKSCNVLIAGDGTAKISDVGLAALLSHQYLTRTAPAGTWAWVAPEVIMGGKVTHKADMYSFGVVLWEIVTTDRPTWKGNLRAIRVPEEAPQEIADLVECCMDSAEQRPDANECASIIQQFLMDPVGGGRSGSGGASSRQLLPAEPPVQQPGSSAQPRQPGEGIEQPLQPVRVGGQQSGVSGQPGQQENGTGQQAVHSGQTWQQPGGERLPRRSKPLPTSPFATGDSS